MYYDFGDDFPGRVSAAGFNLREVEHATNPAAVTFIAEKPSPVAGR